MLIRENRVEMNDAAIYGSPYIDSCIESRIDYGIVSAIPDDDG